jgi:TusA-related sulfurtransferase
MFFKLMCLDRSFFLSRDPQFFEHYPDALIAAGEALRTVEQGSVIEVVNGNQVLLRMRCEKAPQKDIVAASATSPAARQEIPANH